MKLKRNTKINECKGEISFSKPKYTLNQKPILLVISNEVTELNDEQVLRYFFIEEDKYSIIGMTLFNQGHFKLKIFNGTVFTSFDNLKIESCEEADNLERWQITHLFYELN